MAKIFGMAAVRYQTIILFLLLRCRLLLCHGHDSTLRGGHLDPHDEHLHPHPSHRSLGEDFRNEDGIPVCGFPDPSIDVLNELKASRDTSFLRRLVRFVARLGRTFNRSKKNVPTYYHIIQNATIAGPSAEQVREQHAHLVDAFASTGFTFTLKDITFTQNDEWFGYTQYNTVQEREMKTTLRKGGAESLNIYVTNGKGVCGYAYLPKFYTQFTWNDGIVIHFRCFAGASQSQEGDIVVHEVGHWLGLLHTFSNCNEPGDGVSDAPLQDFPTSGCPSVPKNLCGKGSDPADNFMDYSSDACKTRFTPGQAKHMEDEWIRYRT